MRSIFKNVGYAVLLAMIGVYIFLQMTGDNGVSALMKKRATVERLQRENAELARQNELRKARIDRLLDSREEQELEIRRRFKLQKKDNTVFYLPPNEVGAESQSDDDSSSRATTP